jgi:hypothetical protein
MFTPDDIISRYTRADAIEDGVLIDATEAAREVGFKVPVALTSGAWHTCVSVPPELKGREGEDESRRLHDVLALAFAGARLAGRSTRLYFSVTVLGANGLSEPQRLYLHSGPGDSEEHVLTILLEGED